MTKLICENNIIENVHDQPQEKIGTETTDSIVDVVSNVETLIDGKLKEDDVHDGASSGKEETSKESKNKDIAHAQSSVTSSDADEDATNPIKRLENIKNDNNKDEGYQLQRRGTTSRRNDSKSCSSVIETTKPDCVDGKYKDRPNTTPSSHTFHIRRVPEKSYSRPTRTRSQSASRRRRSKSISFPANDLVSVLANITIRYQVRQMS